MYTVFTLQYNIVINKINRNNLHANRDALASAIWSKPQANQRVQTSCQIPLNK